MYKQASRLGLTFITNKGVVSVGQLWGLSLMELASAIKSVKKTLKTEDDNDLDFLTSTKKVDVENELRFNILKDVYITKQGEATEALTLATKKANNEKINALILRKQEGALEEMSIAELEKLLQ